MSVIGDMRDSMMALIDAATSKTSVKWDGDPLAFAPASLPAIGVQWMDGQDSESLEIATNGAYLQEEFFLVLIAVQDDFSSETDSYASDQAFTIMQQISGLNESAITIGGVIDAGRSRPYGNPEWGGKTKRFEVGHAGQSLFLMAFRVERLTE